MNDPASFRRLLEKVKAETEVYKVKLPVPEKALAPVLSKENIDFHYGTLYTNYVKKALAGEGDFQVAGAKLHTLFFEQLQAPKSPNTPTGAIKSLIDEKFGNYEAFKNAFSETAMEIHGSGWAYLDKSGTIKTIANHKIISNVAVIIDMWEHAYQVDYGANKEKYLKDVWKIIDWDIVNARIN